jgi:hypothetical protein
MQMEHFQVRRGWGQGRKDAILYKVLRKAVLQQWQCCHPAVVLVLTNMI